MPRPSARGKIVEAALDLFHARGFTATGVQDIVDAAGVPKGSFYNHFASKEALGLEVIERYRAVTQTQALADASLPPLERVRGHFAELAAIADTTCFARGCLFGNFASELAAHSPEIRARLEEVFTGWTAHLAALLEEAEQRGDLPRGIPAPIRAQALIHGWEGALIHAKVTGSRGPLDVFFAAFPFAGGNPAQMEQAS